MNALARWRLQRWSAWGLAGALPVMFMHAAYAQAWSSHAALVAYLAPAGVRLAWLAVAVGITIHALIGVHEVLDDYVRASGVRRALSGLVVLLHVVSLAVLALAFWRLA